MKHKSKSFATACVKRSKDTKSTEPHQLPLYATAAFEMESVSGAIDIFQGIKKGDVYSRYANPTIRAVSDKIAKMEAFESDLNTWGLMTGSGMSAISTLMYALVKSGQTILTQGDLYGGTSELFFSVMSQHGIKLKTVDFTDKAAIEKILTTDKTIGAIYIETPTNPMISCVDLRSIGELGKDYGIPTIVDNTFATPYLQRPLTLGLDYVIHSTTKYLNGHGNSIAGAIVGTGEDNYKKVWSTLKLMGGTCNAWDAWLIENGMKTLAVRMDRHCSNAMKIANELTAMDNIGAVHYCGLESSPSFEIAKAQMAQFGGMISFEVGSSVEDAKSFIDKLEICTHAPTLGDVDTLVLHPATSSHLKIDPEVRSRYGITDNLVRMSVGIEDPNDLLADIRQALHS